MPNINRMAKALRAAGGTVVWIQTTAGRRAGALGQPSHQHMLTPERARSGSPSSTRATKASSSIRSSRPLPADLRIKKIKYSAFIAGSSDIDAQLKSRGIDTLLVTGTVTNVCCKSTARDAMMLDYRVVMLSDGNASLTDEEHAASLNNFLIFFGDVMTTDEARRGSPGRAAQDGLTRLTAAASPRSPATRSPDTSATTRSPGS